MVVTAIASVALPPLNGVAPLLAVTAPLALPFRLPISVIPYGLLPEAFPGPPDTDTLPAPTPGSASRAAWTVAAFALNAMSPVDSDPTASLKLPAVAAPFDLIFADPPYGAGSGIAVRAAVEQAGWLAPGGWLAIETAKGEAVDPGTLRLDAERDTGPARLTLLQG